MPARIAAFLLMLGVIAVAAASAQSPAPPPPDPGAACRETLSNYAALLAQAQVRIAEVQQELAREKAAHAPAAPAKPAPPEKK